MGMPWALPTGGTASDRGLCLAEPTLEGGLTQGIRRIGKLRMASHEITEGGIMCHGRTLVFPPYHPVAGPCTVRRSPKGNTHRDRDHPGADEPAENPVRGAHGINPKIDRCPATRRCVIRRPVQHRNQLLPRVQITHRRKQYQKNSGNDERDGDCSFHRQTSPPQRIGMHYPIPTSHQVNSRANSASGSFFLQQEQASPPILSAVAFKRISHDTRRTGGAGSHLRTPLLHPHRDLVKAIRGAIL
jgi:hypothetical protein